MSLNINKNCGGICIKMADYEFDVDHPYGDSHLQRKIIHSGHQRVPYPQHEFNWRHYGHNIRDDDRQSA
jgi:hypothetical protein